MPLERTVRVTVTYEVEFSSEMSLEDIEGLIFVGDLDIGPAKADATDYEVEVVE